MRSPLRRSTLRGEAPCHRRQSGAGAAAPEELAALGRALGAAPGAAARQRTALQLLAAAAAASAPAAAAGWDRLAMQERQLHLIAGEGAARRANLRPGVACRAAARARQRCWIMVHYGLRWRPWCRNRGSGDVPASSAARGVTGNRCRPGVLRPPASAAARAQAPTRLPPSWASYSAWPAALRGCRSPTRCSWRRPASRSRPS